MAASHRCRRKIIIGDVHGCYDELIALLDDLEYNSGFDEVYLVGDLVVKAPKSDEVIEFARTHKNVHAVLGNHDYYLLTAAQHIGHYLKINLLEPCKELDDAHPPATNPRHIETAKSVTVENLDYLQSLPLYLYADTNQEILIVHAGIVPDPQMKLEDQSKVNLMTLRNVYFDENEMIGTNKMVDGCRPWVRYYNGCFGHIFFGHDAGKSLQIGAHATGLDTGCCYGNKLTAAIVKCNDNFEILHEEDHIDDSFRTMKWERNAQRHSSRSLRPFPFWIYSVDSFKVYQKPRGAETSELIKMIDHLLCNFS